jgi:hypothetical protein
MDDFDPYTTLFGIDWAFDNDVMLNLNKRQISYETNTLHVVAPLDLYEGDRYNDLMDENAWSSIIENIYQIIKCMEDYINPTVDGELSWRSVNSYDIDCKDAMERWKKKLYEFSIHGCVRITKQVHWIGSELCDAQ